MTTDNYPWPEDTALERARRVATSYRHALEAENPAQCHLLDAQMNHIGQGWVVPTTETVDPDAELSATAIGELLGIKASLVRKWASLGYIEGRDHNGGGGRTFYRLGDVLDYRAARRRRMTGDNPWPRETKYPTT